MARRPSPVLRAAVVRMLKAIGPIDATKRDRHVIAGRMLRGYVRTNTLADLLPLYRDQIAIRMPRYKALLGQLPGTIKRELDEHDRAELRDNIKKRRWLERAIARLKKHMATTWPPGGSRE